jgi:segregation and condensation protein A
MSESEAEGLRLAVATPVFEGPLELLLALAERKDVDILQVPLAVMTRDYLAAITALNPPRPDEMAEFLAIAARLLLLKSIRLLPGEEPEPEETELLGWEEDVRRRLEEYRQYRAVAGELMERVSTEPFAFPPPARGVDVEGQEDPLQLDLLLTAFQNVLSRLPPRPVVVSGSSWTVPEKLTVLEKRLAAGSLELLRVLLESEDRLEAVVTFVALLELLRRGRVRVRQRRSFGEIWVERVG